MNKLSEFLKGLDPSQIDEAVELLQVIKKNKELPIGTDSRNLRPGSDNNQLPQEQRTFCNDDIIKDSKKNSFSNYSGSDTDDVPLYTRFAKSSDFDPIIKYEKTKVACKKRKETAYHKKPLGFIGRSQDGACITIPFNQEELLGRNTREINQKTVQVKSVVPAVGTRNLNSFGFLTSTTKAIDANKNKMFPPFVQDKRQIPEALQLWKQAIPNADKVCTAESAQNEVLASFGDEEFSLLHPPMCLSDFVPNVSHSYSFNDFVEGGQEHSYINLKSNSPLMLERSTAMNCMHINGTCNECPCLFHSKVAEPYRGFNNEVIFSGFFAIGYDPCQARPPYFGTCNHLQGGGRPGEELDQIARFPVGERMLKFSTLDYDYDSGDDWDVMDGEDIGASSSSDSNLNDTNESFNSSDLDFINDDDANDSDCELYRRIIDARQRRLNRLRGKDRLVPLFSGPFVTIPIVEHPLQRFDRLGLLLPLSDNYLSSILENELQAQYNYLADITNKNIINTDIEEARQKKLIQAALKNRREMTDDEINAIHDVVNMNGKVSAKMIVAALLEQHMCVGVARAEIERTVKRFYERKRGVLVRRDQPWLQTDERLFNRNTKHKSMVQCTENFYSLDRLNDEDDTFDGDVGAMEDIDANESMNLLSKTSMKLQAIEETEFSFPACKVHLCSKNTSESQLR